MFRVSSSRPLVLLASAACALAGVLGAAGCAHDAADRHANDLRDGISRLQAETDRLHLASEDEPGTAAVAAPRSDAGVKPLTRTIQLGGSEGDGEDDDPNAPSARPKIELAGPPGAARAPRREREPRDLRDGRDSKAPTSTGRARDVRIEMLGPTPEGGEEAGAPAATAPAAPEPAAPSADAPRNDPKSEPPKPDAPKRRAGRETRERDNKPRAADPKAPKETR